ncbi:MAG: peptidylprolyl isomerase [Capsulimonas sp.]|uniref:peptidylprolyl isomerase n=1 Tax=Capsulimonas sp. TaxID=2494211 RepID=UPI003264050D
MAARSAVIAVASLCAVAAAGALIKHEFVSKRHAASIRSEGARPSGVAATVDGENILLSNVADVAMRKSGPAILDQLIGNALIDQEARKDNIAVSQADIDARVANVRAMMKPRILEDELKQHDMSLGAMRDDLRIEMEAERLASSLLPHVKMRHVREILVRVRPQGAAPSQGDSMHSAAEAKGIVVAIERDLKAGTRFEDLAKRYSDDAANKQKGGDIGVVADVPNSASDSSAQMLCAQPAVFRAMFALKPGTVTLPPVTSAFGYHFLLVVSSAEAHSASEKELYAVATARVREGQFKVYTPKFVQSLKDKANVETYLGTYESGPPGIAASVNGQNITVSQVSDLATRLAGPPVLDDMVTNVVVQHEAAKQNVVVAPAEVDAALSEIRNNIKPRTLSDLLNQSHETMAEFRTSQMYRLLAGKLLVKSIGPQTSAHAKQILILTRGAAASRIPGARPHTESDALAIVAKIQERLGNGRTFEDLARQYSEDPASKKAGGDLGIIQQSNCAFGPNVLAAAQALKPGGITASPVKSDYGFHLIKAVSTRSSHPQAENGLYAAAQKSFEEAEMQMFLHGYLKSLRGRSKVINYLQPDQ